jgi:hypothetical protein
MSDANFGDEDQTVLSQDADTPLPGDEEGAVDAPAGELPVLRPLSTASSSLASRRCVFLWRVRASLDESFN